MINFLSSWAKTLSLAVIIVSILEMLLPNNKTKKYIRMCMGIYILFNIISPFMKTVQASNMDNFDLEKYAEEITLKNTVVDQTSMNSRLNDLYVEQLEKDITEKITNRGYDVISCNISANLSGDEAEAGITKIVLKLEKNEDNIKDQSENVEDKLVDEIQRIKDINISTKSQKKDDKKISASDINSLKEFLKEEYGVDEKCLKIN